MRKDCDSAGTANQLSGLARRWQGGVRLGRQRAKKRAKGSVHANRVAAFDAALAQPLDELRQPHRAIRKVAPPHDRSASDRERLHPRLLVLREIGACRVARPREPVVVRSHAESQDVDDASHRVCRQLDPADEGYAALLAASARLGVTGRRIVIGERHDSDPRVGDHVHKRGRRELAVALVAMKMKVCDQRMGMAGLVHVPP